LGKNHLTTSKNIILKTGIFVFLNRGVIYVAEF